MSIGGSNRGGGQSGHGPIMVLGRGLAPSQATEEIVEGRWIMEISPFFACFACNYVKNII